MDFWKTPTAQLADYVLPAADFLERPDITSHWGIGNFFVVGQKSAEPLFERHNDYELWAGLGKRLLDQAEWPETLEEMLDSFLAPSGRTLPGVGGRGDEPLLHPAALAQVRGAGVRDTVGQGRARAEPVREARRRSLARLHRAALLADPTPTPTEYPLQMIPGSRYRELTASNLRQSARLKRIHPEPIMDIHPQTAAGLGIDDGEWVLIERPEGAIRQRAHFNEGIRLDTVNPDGYWWEPGTQSGEPSLSGVWVSNANAITPSGTEFSSYAGDQPLRGARCRVRKIEPAPAAADAAAVA